MGIKCNLVDLFTFIYREKLDNELTEHELDHVFFGVTDDVPGNKHCGS
jgi:isopentenyl-diphosphate delta-isomerase